MSPVCTELMRYRDEIKSIKLLSRKVLDRISQYHFQNEWQGDGPSAIDFSYDLDRARLVRNVAEELFPLMRRLSMMELSHGGLFPVGPGVRVAQTNEWFYLLAHQDKLLAMYKAARGMLRLMDEPRTPANDQRIESLAVTFLSSVRRLSFPTVVTRVAAIAK